MKTKKSCFIIFMFFMSALWSAPSSGQNQAEKRIPLNSLYSVTAHPTSVPGELWWKFSLNGIYINPYKNPGALMDITDIKIVIHPIQNKNAVKYLCYGQIGPIGVPLHNNRGQFIKIVKVSININSTYLKNKNEVKKWQHRLEDKIGELTEGTVQVWGSKIKEKGYDFYPDEIYLRYTIKKINRT